MSLIMKFEDFIPKLSDKLLRGIYAIGWENPSSTQVNGIPAILSKKDVIIQAHSGTGKTGTFCISLLNNINPELGCIQGIIIVPTIELGTQVYTVLCTLSEFMEINVLKCVGGHNVKDRLVYPERATILVGTPGKLSDICSRNLIKSQKYNLSMIIIDEFDKTFDKDFVPVIQNIFKTYVYENTQIVLSSATINDEVITLSDTFMHDPIKIILKSEEVSLDGIKQYFIKLDCDDHKFETILDLYKIARVAQCIIFVNSKEKCNILEHKFNSNEFTVSHIHGNIDRSEREKIMNDFRNGTIRILLTTDLMARGIDVQTVSLVINYDIPIDSSQYIHRIGRTGRYGKKGCAINLIGNNSDIRNIRAIEDFYKIKIDELPADFADSL